MRRMNMSGTVWLTAIVWIAGIGCRPAASNPPRAADEASAPPVGKSSDSTQPVGKTAGDAKQKGKATKMNISTTAFDHNGKIPKRYSGDGEDVSPQLSWSGMPDGTVEFALICDDPDAPTPQPWVHWVIYKIPATATGLSEKIPARASLSDPEGALQGKNSWGVVGYRGPAPPKGPVHHYYFKLHALDTALAASAGMTKDQLLAAIKGHILAEAKVVGTYQR